MNDKRVLLAPRHLIVERVCVCVGGGGGMEVLKRDKHIPLHLINRK